VYLLDLDVSLALEPKIASQFPISKLMNYAMQKSIRIPYCLAPFVHSDLDLTRLE